jgi:SAM-dependent methyltransferase
MNYNYPLQLNLGSGKNFREDFLNVDLREYSAPDITVDLNLPFPNGDRQTFQTTRFGTIQITKNTFKKILAHDVLEHIPNLTVMMKSCLDLLEVGGEFDILVPYDLSYGAWQDPTHVHAFNEKSWLYYTEWFWYLEWTEARFDLEELRFEPSAFGKELLKKGLNQEEILRTPRAVDSMLVKLRKVLLNEKDRLTLQEVTQRRRPLPVSQTVKFAVAIISPPNYVHSEAFREVAETIHHALLELGHDSILTTITSPTTFAQQRTHIILGANLLHSAPFKPPAHSILYNLEQVDLDSLWFKPPKLNLYQEYPVWDCSLKNIEQLTRLGLTHVQHVPIGYVPQLTRISPAVEDIDVLFYGSLNPRRRHIIEALKAQGVKVEAVFGVYGTARDQLIARAKIVLNMHFYEVKTFEIVRVSYLLANRKFVISERGNDPTDEAPFVSGVVFADYEELVNTCLKFLTLPQDRRQIAEHGFNLMFQRPEQNYLRGAIGQTDLTTF